MPEIVEVTTAQLNFAHLKAYFACLDEAEAMYKDAGGRLIGKYMNDGGGHGEIVFIASWASMKAREDGRVKMMANPSYKKLMDAAGNAIQQMSNWICVPNPCTPLDKVDGSKIKALAAYKAKPGIEIHKRFPEILAEAKGMGVDAPCPLVLHPMWMPCPTSLIACYGEGAGGDDGIMESIFKASTDPATKDKFKAIQEDFNVLTARHLLYLTPEIVGFFKS